MLDRTFRATASPVRELTRCAQCGKDLVAPIWSEHESEQSVRHLWSCEACGYEFETAVRFRARAA
jgi:uncharacterized protein with PIN domain